MSASTAKTVAGAVVTDTQGRPAHRRDGMIEAVYLLTTITPTPAAIGIAPRLVLVPLALPSAVMRSCVTYAAGVRALGEMMIAIVQVLLVPMDTMIGVKKIGLAATKVLLEP